MLVSRWGLECKGRQPYMRFGRTVVPYYRYVVRYGRVRKVGPTVRVGSVSTEYGTAPVFSIFSANTAWYRSRVVLKLLLPYYRYGVRHGWIILHGQFSSILALVLPVLLSYRIIGLYCRTVPYGTERLITVGGASCRSTPECPLDNQSSENSNWNYVRSC